MSEKFSVIDFLNEFSDDNVCLQRIFEIKYKDKFCPKCNCLIIGNYKRTKNRQSYGCDKCANQVYPTQGTIYQKSTTPLSDWLYILYCFCSVNNGISAKEIQANIGVNYSTALRIGSSIRGLFRSDEHNMLSGTVEIRECIILNGSIRWGGWWRLYKIRKSPILGMVERGGKVVVAHSKDREPITIEKLVRSHVKEGSRVFTSKWRGYKHLHKHYTHEQLDYRNGQFSINKEIHINNINIFLGKVRNKLKINRHLSEEYVLDYCYEMVYKYNHKHFSARDIFNDLLQKSIKNGS